MKEFSKIMLLNFCREKKIKKTSRKNKLDLERLLRDRIINEMKLKTDNHHDPIDLSSFDEWTTKELLFDNIFLHNYYYKKINLKNYINTVLNSNHNLKEIKDPINLSCFIPQSIFSSLKNEKTHYQKVEDFISIDVRSSFYSFNEYKFHGLFLFISVNKNKKVDIVTKLEITKNVSDLKIFFIGFLPTNISVISPRIDSFSNYNQRMDVPSLDIASTSDAIVSRIKNLYEKHKLTVFVNKVTTSKNFINQIKILNLKNLNSNFTTWFNNFRNIKYVDTTSKNCKYYRLLQELEEYEIK